jgi:UDP-glucuronate 4-epimerase
MHILVTGGAGFIGSQLIQSILRNNPEAHITCIDNFDPFYPEAIKRKQISPFLLLPGFRLLELDLAEHTAAELDALIPQPVDCIVHLAAKAGVRPSIEDPEGYLRANMWGLQHLLDFARLRGIQQFVFASSSSVYGVNPNLPWQEDEKLLPISPYAMTKLSGEMMGHVYHKLYGIRFIALRFFTVYGPGQRPDLAIHSFARKIMNGDAIRMYGKGDSSRDYTFIDDIVQGIEAAMQYKDSGFEIINLGNSETVSLSELIAALEKHCGRKAIIEQWPEQPGDVPHTFADISKAKKLLNYQPKVSLEEGLEKFVEWLRV